MNGINLTTKAVFPVKVRVIKRNGGAVEMTSLGIKKGEAWLPCNRDLISLQKMYQSATDNNERSAILGLMDYGNYLLDTDAEVFILK